MRTLRRLVARQTAREEELLVHPALFQAVAGTDADVTVLAKTSPYRNELTRFRYDVVLTARPAAAPPPRRPTGGPGPDRPRCPGTAGRAPTAGVPCPMPGWARTCAPSARCTRPATTRPSTGLRRTLAADPEEPAADPAALAEHRPRGRPRDGAAPGSRTGHPGPGVPAPAATPSAPAPLPRPDAGTGTWEAYTNDPQRAARERLVVAALREHLARTLPDFMVPASLAVLEEWPLGRTGKLDRAALPLPDGLRPTLATGYVAPRTATERAVALGVVRGPRRGPDRCPRRLLRPGRPLPPSPSNWSADCAPWPAATSRSAPCCAPTVAAVAALLDRASDTAATPVPIQRAARHPISEHRAEEGR